MPKAKGLVAAVAEDLAQSTYNVLNGAMTKYYDRTFQDPNDKYSVYVYDYRDVDAISVTLKMHVLIQV